MRTVQTMNEYFEVIRGGINSTFQDEGRKNFSHIGLPFSGVMDKRNFIIANTIPKIKEKKNERSYYLIEELNTKPSVFYKTKVRNKKI